MSYFDNQVEDKFSPFHFSKKTKSEKIGFFIYTTIVIILFILGVIAFTYGEQINAFFNNLIAQQTSDFLKTICKGIEPLIWSIIYIIFTLMALRIEKIIMFMIKVKSQRMNTIVLVVNSFIRFVIVLVGLLFVLYAWGVNTTGLVASAGIVTAIVGFGTQSIVADIFSGVFIVFEGNLQVGDFIEFNGFKGTIREIGMRNTVIEDLPGNYLIVRNSELKVVINMSKKPTALCLSITVSSSSNLKEVEKLLKDNLVPISSSIEELSGNFEYKGVSKINENSYEIFVIGKCLPNYQGVCTRAFYSKIKILFEENNISTSALIDSIKE